MQACSRLVSCSSAYQFSAACPARFSVTTFHHVKLPYDRSTIAIRRPRIACAGRSAFGPTRSTLIIGVAGGVRPARPLDPNGLRAVSFELAKDSGPPQPGKRETSYGSPVGGTAHGERGPTVRLNPVRFKRGRRRQHRPRSPSTRPEAKVNVYGKPPKLDCEPPCSQPGDIAFQCETEEPAPRLRRPRGRARPAPRPSRSSHHQTTG